MKLTRNLRLLLAASGIVALLPLGCGGATKNAKTEKSRTACGTGTCGGEAPAKGKAADKSKEKSQRSCGAGGCGDTAPAKDKGKANPIQSCGTGGCGGAMPDDKTTRRPPAIEPDRLSWLIRGLVVESALAIRRYRRGETTDVLQIAFADVAS
jgi:hypothetical protein